ncbi:MAG: HNH endonuclease [Athalassotoga sp.]
MEKIPSVIREYVWRRDHGKCRICGSPADDVHHIFSRRANIPKHLGVPETKKNHHPLNLIAVCRSCHSRIHNTGMPRETKEVFIKANQSLSYIHFDDALEKHVKDVLEELSVEDVRT